MKKQIRVGILCDDFMIPAWAYLMIEKLAAAPYCEICLVVKNNNEPAKKTSLFKKLIRDHKKIMYGLFTRFDRSLFKNSPDAFALADLHDLYKGPVLEVETIRTRFSDRFTTEAVTKIRSYELDVLIRLGFGILRGEILQAAKYGVWSFHHGDNDINRGGPAGFWEVFHSWPETGVILQRLTEQLDGGIVLKKSFSLTDRCSPSRNKNNYYWKALSFIPEKIRELYVLGDKKFEENYKTLNNDLYFYSSRLYLEPTNSEILRGLPSYIGKVIAYQFQKKFTNDQWVLLFKLSRKEEIATSLYQFQRIVPPKDRFWADPHIIFRNGKYYIFIEELIFRQNKGFISVMEMDAAGTFSKPVKVLEKDYHLSYPFIIEHEGATYMIPESSANNTIDIYKCTEFPHKWEFVMTLMNNVKAVDATVIFKEGKFWLFANIAAVKGASTLDELYIFYSDELLSSDWQSHASNPVISDVKRSRPAGNFFYHKGKLYRPSQNSSNRYGYGLQINQVNTLNEYTYEEKTINSIYPNWSRELRGTHTISFVKNLTVIDAVVKRKRFF